MLVLSRKLGERIVVPQCGLAVTVLAVKGKAVRLGISAPEDMTVYRGEIWQRVGPQEVDANDNKGPQTKAFAGPSSTRKEHASIPRYDSLPFDCRGPIVAFRGAGG